MISLIDSMRQKNTVTNNGAVTNSTSLNPVLDLFFIAGASRNISEVDLFCSMERAWAFDKLLTLKLIFWASDIRGGVGERRFFRVALDWLQRKDMSTFIKNITNVPFYNRWDSLFTSYNASYGDDILKYISENINDGLLCKWLPRKKQYNNFADKLRRYMNISAKEYRKLIVKNSKTVEQLMSKNQWDEINYSHVPSVASNKYRAAFHKHDTVRYTKYIEDVINGKEKINASAIFPYDIYRAYKKNHDKKAINAQWRALPNYLEDSDKRILPVCDVSGSMNGLPMDISISLGVYLSERNNGIFKDAFVTFSGNPELQYLKGDTCSRFSQLHNAEWGMNTDLNKVFDLVLNSAIRDSIPESEMPNMLLIISDMEFDECGSLTNYEAIVEKYKNAGYEVPTIIFWNCSGRIWNVPVSKNNSNVALVSGASPSIVKSVLSGDIEPINVMLKTLNSDRYERVLL